MGATCEDRDQMYRMYKMEPIGINRANRDQGSSHPHPPPNPTKPLPRVPLERKCLGIKPQIPPIKVAEELASGAQPLTAQGVNDEDRFCP